MCQKKIVPSTALLVATAIFYNLSYLNKVEGKLVTSQSLRSPKLWNPPAPNNSEDFLINTIGCKIPNFTKVLEFDEPGLLTKTCDKRLVDVVKTSEDKITFRIDEKNQHLKCSYQFAQRKRLPGHDDESLSYTKLKPFKNGDTVLLESEIVLVECDLKSSKNNSISIENYKDAYLVLKKKPLKHRRKKLKENMVTVLENWNVLIIGIDTMSRARAYNSLPKTVDYLKKHHWLDYRGYQKTASNTFPNMMAILAGLNSSAAFKYCFPGMDQCRRRLIWKKFSQSGYITAFGEDYLSLPDTFARYKLFTIPPTDHYARPFFLAGEYSAGNTICTKNKPSSRHLIEYASQFAKAYKNDSFFGHFWLNSYSHDLRFLPKLFEDSLLEFFEDLNRSGVLDNTFVFFLSDHGIRFGERRLPKEMYYEERMPMLFLWVPYQFRETYPIEYYNMQLNQYRLTSPYNVHTTLWKLMQLTDKEVNIVPPEACPQCNSLTEEIPAETTCRSAHIDEKWCTCHDMTSTDKNDAAADLALKVAVEHVQNMSRSIKTKKCTECAPLHLKKVLRSHRYFSGNKAYYIIAFAFDADGYSMAYEAKVEYYDGKFKVLAPTDTMSLNDNRCVLNVHEGSYCNCRHRCR